MATIASLAVQLTANAQEFNSGLKTASDNVKRFAGIAKGGLAEAMTDAIPGGQILKVIDKIIGALKFLANMAGKTIGAITGVVKGVSQTVGTIADQISGGNLFGAVKTGVQAVTGVVQGVAEKIPLVGGAISATVGLISTTFQEALNWGQRLLGWFKEGAGYILQMRSASIQLGVSFQEAGALSLAGGGDIERMTRALTHWNSTVQAARMGDAAAIALISGKLHLEAEALARMGTIGSFEKGLQALGKIDDALTETSVSLGAFGERAALAFGPLLKSGKNLDRFREKVKRFGLDLGEDTSGGAKAMENSILAGKRALQEVDLAIQGIKMNIAAGLAPMLIQLQKQFADVGVDAKKVQEWALQGAEWLAKGGAMAIDAWKGFQTFLPALQQSWNDFVSGYLDGLKSIFDYLGKLPGQAGGVFQQLSADVGKELKQYQQSSKKLAEEIKRRQAAPSAMSKVEEFFKKLRGNAATAKQAAQNANANQAAQKKYAPVITPVKLAAAAGFGSQEAYKTLGEFAAGQSSSIGQKQLEATKKLQEVLKGGVITLKDIKKQIRRALVRKGKI